MAEGEGTVVRHVHRLGVVNRRAVASTAFSAGEGCLRLNRTGPMRFAVLLKNDGVDTPVLADTELLSVSGVGR